MLQVYSGKRTTAKETIITKSSEQEESVVGHFIVFVHEGERRFGEVKSMKDSQLTVHLFRLVSDQLIRVTSRFNNCVEVIVENPFLRTLFLHYPHPNVYQRESK